jgi:hypothetical protein
MQTRKQPKNKNKNKNKSTTRNATKREIKYWKRFMYGGNVAPQQQDAQLAQQAAQLAQQAREQVNMASQETTKLLNSSAHDLTNQFASNALNRQPLQNALPAATAAATATTAGPGVIQQIQTLKTMLEEINVFASNDPNVKASLDTLKADLSQFLKTVLCISIKSFFSTCQSMWSAIPFIGIPSNMDRMFKDFTISFGKVSEAVNKAVESVNSFSEKMKQIQNATTNATTMIPSNPLQQLQTAQQLPTQATPAVQSGGKRQKYPNRKLSHLLETFFNTAKTA